MKIVATASSDKKMIGLASAFLSANIEYIIWDEHRKPAFDMYNEIKPGLLLTDKPLSKALEKLSKTEILNVLFINQPEQDNNYQLRPAANLAQIQSDETDIKYESDILVISDNSVIPLVLHDLYGKYKVKIIGSPVVNPYYVGTVNARTRAAFMRHTKVGIDIEEDFWDYAANKAFCVHQDNSAESIEIALKDTKLRQKTIAENYQKVMEANTYYHRAMDIAKLAILENEYSQLSNTFGAVKCKLASH